jgi:predicted oxidoreductase
LIGRRKVADGTTGRTVHQADMVIVGGGAAGGTAALEASAAGATFVALDQLAQIGGTAATSGGGTCIAGTAFQRSRGIDDSPELAFRDLIEASQGEADLDWARFYLEHSARDLYEYLTGIGVQYFDLKHQEHNTVPRWHQPRGAGQGIMDAIWAELGRQGLQDCWHFSMEALDLIWDGDRVVGVLARDKDGREHEFRGQTVIMATGGFMGNLDMVRQYGPQLEKVERVLVGGGVGALGKGHRILERYGAVLTHMDNLWCYMYATPDYKDASGRRGLVIRGIEDNIWVTKSGRRFHNEFLTGAGFATPALLEQDPPTCWAILDHDMAMKMEISDPYYRRGGVAIPDKTEELLENSPYIHKGDTPEELARAAGIDVEGFSRTFNEWLALLRSGAEMDPATGRKLGKVQPFAQPPYYAVQFFPLARKNLGGVKTDLQCHVVTADGKIVPGLYAAGELCGMAGGHIAGKRALEGIMIGASLFSGRVAGAWAAREAGHGDASHLDARVPMGAAAAG